jgi:cyclase
MMKKQWIKIAAFFCVFVTQYISAQNDSVFDCQRVSGNIYCLYGRGGNIGILATDEGILVVDSQFESTADTVLKIIQKISLQDIKYLINTHYHADHTGGNEKLGEKAEIIMHPNCKLTKKRLLNEAGVKLSFIDRVRNWEKDMAIDLGGETVRLLYFGNAHTSGDLVVVFENSKVIHTGDLFFHGRPPYIDVEDGSDTENWIRIIETLCKQYPDFSFIPGHGEVTDAKHYLKFAQYLKSLRTIVVKSVEAGRSKDQTIESVNLDLFSPFFDLKSDSDSIIKNVGWVYDEIMLHEKSWE